MQAVSPKKLSSPSPLVHLETKQKQKLSSKIKEWLDHKFIPQE
jgi:hypothetical protein